MGQKTKRQFKWEKIPNVSAYSVKKAGKSAHFFVGLQNRKDFVSCKHYFMIDILHYVAFDSATQTLRYKPQNFGQISTFRQIWSYFQRKHLSIKNYSHNYHSQ